MLSPDLILIAERVWRGYLDNVSMVRAVAGRYGIKTFFAWQPVPYFRSLSEQRIMDRLQYVYAPGAFQSPVYHWLAATKFPELGDKPWFWNLSGIGRDLGGVHYLDVCHYTARMAEAIAEAPAERLADAPGGNPRSARRRAPWPVIALARIAYVIENKYLMSIASS